MAREGKEGNSDRMPFLLYNIRMQNTYTECEGSNFHDIIRNLVQKNSKNMPPVLLTEEERTQIQRDRQKAIECEKLLARRRQEKYFDLVDQVQNALKLIEKKNSRKDKVTESAICDIPDVELNSTSIGSPVSNDCNNNSSPNESETFFENTAPFPSSLPSNRKLSAEGGSTQGSSKQGRTSRRKHNSSRHSLPANFEDYHNFSYTPENFTNSEHVLHNSQPRPLSVFSDHPSMYPDSFQLANGSPRGQLPVAQNSSFRTTWHDSALGTNLDMLNNSPMSASSDSGGAIKKQQDLLILEQKRLEEHFNTLQGQLFAEFQQQQNNLLEMYKESMETQAEHEKSLQSILERSYESSSIETIVLNTSDKENYTEGNVLGEFSKSPFNLGPRRVFNDSQRSTPNTGITVRSFNSETSIQEFYEITHFREKGKRGEIVEQGRKSEEMGKVAERSQILRNTDRTSSLNSGGNFMSSQKLTQLDSFEARTKEIKDVGNYEFSMVSAHAKGFLTRLLFQTEKVTSLITTLKDAKNVLNEMKSEMSPSITDRSLMERVKTQLQSAQSELRKIFIDVSPRIRMEILQQNRKLLKEKQVRNENKVISQGSSQTRPRLSNATLKKQLSRQQSYEKPLKSGKTSTPSPLSVSKTTVGSRTTSRHKAKAEQTKTLSGVALTAAKTTCVTDTTTTTTTTTSKTSGKTAEISRTVRNKSASKVTKPTKKTVVDPSKKRRTWDASLFKPIQGRISPTLPQKSRASTGDRKQPSLTTRKIEQKVATDRQARDIRGASGTVGSTRVNSRTFKVDSRQPHRPPWTGARRSLAANLSNK